MNVWRLSPRGSLEAGAAVPPSDRGFRYGMSVFETLAIHRGRALFLAEHCALLGESVAALGGRVEPWLPDIVRMLAAALPDGVLRLYVTAGPGGLTDPFRGETYLLHEEMPLASSDPARVAACVAIHMPPPGGRKSGNYWANADAVAWARSQGLDDALLLNPCGHLVGAGTANVFLRIGGEWQTPCRDVGARAGVVRQWVLETFGATEAFLETAALAACDAAFLTNSRIGIRPVAEIDGRPLEVCHTFSERYREVVLGI